MYSFHLKIQKDQEPIEESGLEISLECGSAQLVGNLLCIVDKLWSEKGDNFDPYE